MDGICKTCRFYSPLMMWLPLDGDDGAYELVGECSSFHNKRKWVTGTPLLRVVHAGDTCEKYDVNIEPEVLFDTEWVRNGCPEEGSCDEEI